MDPKGCAMFHTIAFVMLATVAMTTAARPQVLLVSMSGFRWDYFDRTDTPNFDAMRARGVTMDHMNSTFPTMTIPNLYTMATGLYPESHGIISSRFYVPEDGVFFRSGSNQPWMWEQGEPMWITAVKAKLKANVYFWPGSETSIDGVKPSHYIPYSLDAPSFSKRVNTTLRWLADGVDLALMNFDEPEKTGTRLGPDAAGMSDVIARMDGVLGDIRRGLRRHGLQNKVNLIVTSDHGMAKIDLQNKVVPLDEVANDTVLVKDGFQIVERGAIALLRPEPGMADTLVAALRAHPGVKGAWRRDEIPEKYHIKHSPRTSEVLAVAHDGWMIEKNANGFDRGYRDNGSHGYDAEQPNMWPMFVAEGPDFCEGVKVNSISNRDLYPLVCHLLDVKPAPHNGSLARAQTLLRSGPCTPACSHHATSAAVTVTLLSLMAASVAV